MQIFQIIKKYFFSFIISYLKYSDVGKPFLNKVYILQGKQIYIFFLFLSEAQKTNSPGIHSSGLKQSLQILRKHTK